MITERMSVLRIEEGVSYRAQCQACGLAYSSLMRWKGRRSRGEPAWHQPGPAKCQQPDWARLELEIEALGHGNRRSAGAGVLWERYKDQLSRRQLQGLISECRDRHKHEHRHGLQRIKWLRPGLVWSMDDMELPQGGEGGKLYVHAVQDLGSRYKLSPLLDRRLANGQAVARHLEALFKHHGPPLFLKRDNHGNLNSHEIEAVMQRFMVLPLNSPPYYPPYNGGIERCQCEIKSELAERLKDWRIGTVTESVLAAVIHDLNHQPRPCLGGQTACAMFSLGMKEAHEYTRFKRKEVCEWIRSLAAHLMAQGNGARPMTAARSWRLAAQMWLQCNGVISVAEEEKCYPVF
jgi:transposase InsO family protein